jgi:peptide chain release factor 2
MLLRMYTRWAERSGYKVEVLEECTTARRPASSRRPPDQGPQRLWLAEDRVRRAPPGAHLALRQPGAAAHQLRQRLGLSGGRRHHRDRDQRGDVRSTPTARPAPAASTSTPPTRRPHHPHPDRHRRRLPERALQHKNRATAWNMLKARLYELELQKREARPTPRPPPRPRSAGATRSAPTSCSPTRW